MGNDWIDWDCIDQDWGDDFRGEHYDLGLEPGPRADTPLASDHPEAHARPRRYRDVLGRFASGVTVVTAMHGGGPVGMTCQSFTAVSLEPQLVLFCATRTSRAWPAIRGAGEFCVNILSASQVAHSTTMSTKGIDKFAEIAWEPAPHNGAPLLTGGLAHLECRLYAVHPGGDHDVVLGEVQHAGTTGEHDPLLFFEGGYRYLRD